MKTDIQIIKHIRPLCFYKDQGQDFLLCSKGYLLYRLHCENLSLSLIGSINLKTKSIFSKLSALRRVFRLGFSSAIQVNDNIILLTDKKIFFVYDIGEKNIAVIFDDAHYIQPLTLNQPHDSDNFYYGEYVRIRDGSMVSPSVYSISRDLTISKVFTFPKDTIEHVHHVYYWKKLNTLIVLTGDFSKTIGIWIYDLLTDNLQPLYMNGQSSRFCWMYCEKDIFYTATDSQLEANYFKSLHVDRDKLVVLDIRNIEAICGSSIFSCENNSQIFFSTAVEPGMPSGSLIKDLLSTERGPGIHDDYSRIYAFSKSGSKPLVEILSAEKDAIPSRLGQFGTFSFPSGQNPTDYLFAYGIAIKHFGDCLVRVKGGS